MAAVRQSLILHRDNFFLPTACEWVAVSLRWAHTCSYSILDSEQFCTELLGWCTEG